MQKREIAIPANIQLRCSQTHTDSIPSGCSTGGVDRWGLVERRAFIQPGRDRLPGLRVVVRSAVGGGRLEHGSAAVHW